MTEKLKFVRKESKALQQAKIMPNHKVRAYDIANKKPIHVYTGNEIREMRKKENVSPAVFASCLNISVESVRKWETTDAKPSGSALKLLDLVHKKGLAYIID